MAASLSLSMTKIKDQASLSMSKIKDRVSSIIAADNQAAIAAKAKKLASDTTYVAKKLAVSTRNAAWYTFCTALIIGVPWFYVHDREALIQLEEEHARNLGLTSQELIHGHEF